MGVKSMTLGACASAVCALLTLVVFAATVCAEESTRGLDDTISENPMASDAADVPQLSMEEVATQLTDSMRRIRSYEANYELRLWRTGEEAPHVDRLIVSAMQRVPDGAFPFLDMRCERFELSYPLLTTIILASGRS